MAFVARPRRRSMYLAATAALVGAAATARAQAAPAATSNAPEVGQMAPDFTLPGATRYGLLQEPVHLADFRGNTVVLAFFFQARTKG